MGWARQLDIAENLRSEQGHHRTNASQSSVRLYSSDDVFGALKLQLQIVDAIRSPLILFRPLRPQRRGAEAPLPEPGISLPGIPTVGWSTPIVPELHLPWVSAHFT